MYAEMLYCRKRFYEYNKYLGIIIVIIICFRTILFYFFIWGNSPQRAKACSFTTHHTVGLLLKSDKFVAETCTWQHTTLTTDIHVLDRIRTRNLNMRATADLSHRRRGHWDRLSGTLLFNICTNNLSKVIKHSKYWIFDDDIKIFRAINYVEHCTLLQSDTEGIQGWCTANCMKLNSSKTAVITFTRNTLVLYYTYELRNPPIPWTDTIKELVVQLDSEFHFHAYADYVFSQSVRMLGLIRTVTSSISTLGI
jgi:hypothetical protein